MGIKRLMLIVFCGEDRKRRLPFVGGAVMSLIHLWGELMSVVRVFFDRSSHIFTPEMN